jgi:hypothetical protein
MAHGEHATYLDWRNTHIVKTMPNRLYYVFEKDGLFTAAFQPINKKTGLPWQAQRSLRDGADRCVLQNYKTRERLVLDQGTIPKDWHKTYGGEYNTACGGFFSTRELAIAAVEAHSAKGSR